MTHSGKTSESAARSAVNGAPVGNETALRNPECLPPIADHPLLRERAVGAAGRSMRERVAEAWAESFGLPELPQDDAHFFELGGNSLMAVRLLARMRELTGRELPLSTFMRAPTLAQFIHVIECEPAIDAHGSATCARAGHGRPVFLVHGLSGTVMECWPLISLLRSARPLYGFQARGLDDGHAPHDEVGEIARAYVEHVRRVQPHGPYSLWGFSFGGVVALEIARALAEHDEQVEHVGLIDTYVRQDLDRWSAMRDVFGRALRRASHQPVQELPGYALERFAQPKDEALVLGAAQQRVHDAMWRALETYRPQPFDGGPVAYLRAAVPLGGFCDPLPVWQRTAAAGLRVVRLPGGHLDLVRKTSALAARAIDSTLAAR